MRIIGNKWTGSILWHLKDQPMRFNEIARQLAGASKKVLAERLKAMEENKLITRDVISSKPVAVQYKIAARGLNALTILEELKNWTLENDL
ncbi:MULTISPECIES: helix-turn-helix domain-containing protein [unclassified Methylophaga]|nr:MULTISPECIES: helix-turn-helix domain-containing protein [unclassified Methylophaga]MAL50595.1 transcriptional regulator [Methylophaga sp.]MBP25781.1 transcriptional regulator [Methylophaga sp.]MDX1751104.1 helix-turn-helix domain-containing protein [Methylophaga sp.]HAD31801.1 transcriptional regulator [Methylophaga sp.]HCC81231.1 transcriptional regulator [Methylophaga sp.]